MDERTLLRVGCLGNLRSLLIHVAGEALEMHARLTPEYLRSLSALDVVALESDLRRMASEREIVAGYVAMVEEWANET